ncbi:MAG: hypothetical protein LC725_11660 [Lentisphaerae bacterium]|nr:hypothetical protein [Lentisphaerota bacterium]
MRWIRQHDERGPCSFYVPRNVRGGKIITTEKAVECGRLLDAGMRIADVARRAGINESALRKAVKSGRIPRRGGRPEALRHIPPGEMGKVLGLDRAPEVRTLREKIAVMSGTGTPMEWMKELSKTWMEADP